MTEELAEGRTDLRYYAKVREYAIVRKDPEDIVIDTIQFCPWCGIKLPTSLRNELFEEVVRVTGIEATLDDFWDRNPQIPAEFFSDAWWRKRGL